MRVMPAINSPKPERSLISRKLPSRKSRSPMLRTTPRRRPPANGSRKCSTHIEPHLVRRTRKKAKNALAALRPRPLRISESQGLHGVKTGFSERSQARDGVGNRQPAKVILQLRAVFRDFTRFVLSK